MQRPAPLCCWHNRMRGKQLDKQYPPGSLLSSKESLRQSLSLSARATEGAGAISVAAAIGMSKQERGKCACILTDGSIDAEKLSKYLKLV